MAMMESGVIDIETLDHLRGILEDLVEKMKIATMIGMYIEEELNKKYDAKIQRPHENNFKNGTRTIQVNTRQRRFLFFFARKRTRDDYVCTISVHFDKVEIRGPTYPEHYGNFLSSNPKFMDNILRYVVGCINQHKKFPCIRAYQGLPDGKYDQELADGHIQALNVPIISVTSTSK